MKDVVQTIVKDGKRNLTKMLDDLYGITQPKTVRGVWIEYTNREWKTVVKKRDEIVSLAEKQGITIKFNDSRKSVNFKFFR